MVIELKTENIIRGIKVTSHREVAEIADPDARYRAEAGTEKHKEIYRCVVEAIGKLQHRCLRFLSENYKGYRNDNAAELPNEFVFEFDMAERRAMGKTDSLAATMHAFAVEYALSKFYSVVSQPDLSNKHSLLAMEAGKELDLLLYSKNPPRI